MVFICLKYVKCGARNNVIVKGDSTFLKAKQTKPVQILYFRHLNKVFNVLNVIKKYELPIHIL